MESENDIIYLSLLQLLGNSLFESKIDVDLSSVDLEALHKEAKRHTVVAQTYNSLPKSAIEKNIDTASAWQVETLRIMRDNNKQANCNCELDKLLLENGIDYCTIKGFSSAVYYNNPALRQMGDIDFLVKESDKEKTFELLLNNGYICEDEEEEHNFHIAFKKEKYLYEMHFGLIEDCDKSDIIKKFTEGLLENATEIDLPTGKIKVPDKLGHGTVMLLHLRRHMRDGSGIGLRHFCDWAVFANSITDEEWENDFYAPLCELGLLNMALAFSKASSVFLGMKEKKWFSDYAEETSRLLLNDILISGNFGKGILDRSKANFFTNGRSRGFISNFLHSSCLALYQWNRFYKEHKILVPVGLVAYFFRTLFLVVFKHKKLGIKDGYEKGTQRSKLYNEIFKE